MNTAPTTTAAIKASTRIPPSTDPAPDEWWRELDGRYGVDVPVWWIGLLLCEDLDEDPDLLDFATETFATYSFASNADIRTTCNP